MPSKKFYTHRIHIREGLTILHGRKSFVPNDGIYFWLCFLENFRIHYHSKEKCGYCGRCLLSVHACRCDSCVDEKSDSPCQIHLNDAPCQFQFTERGPGLVAVADAIQKKLGVAPNSAIHKKWVEDLLQVAEYHYRVSGIQVSMTPLIVPKKAVI